ncbi:MAG TPA: alpha/beta hydrolase [Paucimonas sp.]|nr:alpha/beta hydrolase [Paucimonas sp.]
MSIEPNKMNAEHLLVLGIGHQIAPHFILNRLLAGAGITCVADDAHAVERMKQGLRKALLQMEAITEGDADRTLDRVRHSHSLATPQAPESGADALHWFLSKRDLLNLANPEKGVGRLPAPLGAMDAEENCPSRLHLIVDRHHLPAEGAAGEHLRSIERSLKSLVRPDVRISVHCLGACIDDNDAFDAFDSPDAAPEMQTASPLAQLIGLTNEVTRRCAAYFSHYPLPLPQEEKPALRVMAASGAAQALAAAAAAPNVSFSMIAGSETADVDAILHRSDMYGTNTVPTAHGAAAPANAGNVTLQAEMAAIAALAAAESRDLGETRANAPVWYPAPPGKFALPQLLQRAHLQQDEENRRMRLGFADLPEASRQVPERDGLRYFCHGGGSRVLLVVNAFGLSLDFWQMLTRAVAPRFKVLLVERSGAAQAGGIPTTYYSSKEYIQDYLADIRAVLDREEVRHCHVVSWCSGGKFALELAHAFKERILSLSLIAPSFAGIDGFAGSDSEYEKNLFTMCKIVNQMPQTAGSMAKAMMGMMTKNGSDMERFAAGNKDMISVFELPDHHHLPAIYRPFSSPENLVEFSRQLMNFRSHDIRPLLESGSLQLPVMLVTGRADTTTSSARAKDICSRLPYLVGFDIAAGSHYLVHQNHRLVAELLDAFVRDGLDLDIGDRRIARSQYRNPIVQEQADRQQALCANA